MLPGVPLMTVPFHLMVYVARAGNPVKCVLSFKTELFAPFHGMIKVLPPAELSICRLLPIITPDIVDEPVFTDILVIIEFAGIVLPLNEIQLEFVVNGGIPIIIIDPVCDNVFDCI